MEEKYIPHIWVTLFKVDREDLEKDSISFDNKILEQTKEFKEKILQTICDLKAENTDIRFEQFSVEDKGKKDLYIVHIKAQDEITQTRIANIIKRNITDIKFEFQYSLVL